MGKKEKKNMYMNKEDQKLILREVVTAMRRFHDLDESSIEDLGLEWIVENQGVERKKRMKSAIDVVLQRQRQFRILNPSKSKILNDLWLDKHYRPFSKVSPVWREAEVCETKKSLHTFFLGEIP